MSAVEMCRCGHTRDSHAPGNCFGCWGEDCDQRADATAQVRACDHGSNGRGVVIENGINGEYGPLQVWLPGSAGYPAEVSFPDDFWRGDRADLVAMRDLLDLAIRTMDEGVE